MQIAQAGINDLRLVGHDLFVAPKHRRAGFV